MPPPPYLTPQEMAALIAAAVSSQLVYEMRPVRMDAIEGGFVASIPFGSSPLAAFTYEIQACNRIERLLNGTVPIAQFLTNCTNWLKLRALPEALQFAGHANDIGNDSSGTPKAEIAAALSPLIKEEAIIGRNEMLDFGFLRQGADTGKSVGRIVVPRFDGGQQRKLGSGQPWTMTGTAWMIAENLAITNHHVINARTAGEAQAAASDFEKQAVGAEIEFDFDAPNAAKTVIPIAALMAFDAVLDFAVVALQRAGPAPLRLHSQALAIGAASWQPVNIIQHPLGGYKKVGIRSNIATEADDKVVRYFTDTDTGSSGSPVCDDNWRVVALHRGAQHVIGVKFQGQDTAYVNLGSQIQAVLAEIHKQVPAIGKAIADSQALLGD